MNTKKFFWAGLLAWVVLVVGMFAAMKHDTNNPGIQFLFMGIFTPILGILSFVPYFLVKNNNEVASDMRNTWFCEKYDELKEKHSPILKEISVYWIFGRTRFNVTLSICQDALFISDAEGLSFCVPYTQYAIHKEKTWLSGDFLVIDNAVPEAIAAKTYLRRSMELCHRSLHPKEFDLVMSLVEQAKQKQQNTINTMN